MLIDAVRHNLVHMPASKTHFPRGKYYALTWSIPDDFGGMTGALLHRSRAFSRLGGVFVEILTMDDRPDYDEVAARLTESGELVEGVRMRNLWDDLRERTVGAAKTRPEPAAPLVTGHRGGRHDAVVHEGGNEGCRIVVHDGVVLVHECRDEGGVSLATDRFRRDGTLLFTERREKGRRSLVLYDSEGQPLRRWRSRHAFYRWWLDRVLGKKLSFLIVDSKTSARCIPDYRRDNVVTVHIVHAAHREPFGAPELRASRAAVLKRTNDFDAVVVLSERQRLELLGDLSALGIDSGGRIRVIPNGATLPDAQEHEHIRGEGIVIASLDERKRVDCVIDAVAGARQHLDQLSLHIYGGGPSESLLREQIVALNAEKFITLHGYQPGARLHFQTADFSLLTSTSEGFPLVLVESMAAGCIPIAFDIRYGPADIIRDGVNGYLVPEGDIFALAARIVQLQGLPPARLKSMRRKARARSRAFSDLEVARRWAKELQRALDAKRMREVAGKPLRLRLRKRVGVTRRRIYRLIGR